MIAAALLLLLALGLVIGLPFPFWLLGLIPAIAGYWVRRESLRGRWDR